MIRVWFGNARNKFDKLKQRCKKSVVRQRTITKHTSRLTKIHLCIKPWGWQRAHFTHRTLINSRISRIFRATQALARTQMHTHAFTRCISSCFLAWPIHESAPPHSASSAVGVQRLPVATPENAGCWLGVQCWFEVHSRLGTRMRVFQIINRINAHHLGTKERTSLGLWVMLQPAANFKKRHLRFWQQLFGKKWLHNSWVSSSIEIWG